VKKAIIAILAFLYLGLAGGVVLNVHYCMGQFSSVDYGYDEHSDCGKCGMKEKDGCCNTEVKVVKLQDSHQWVNSDWPLHKYVPAVSFSENELPFYTSPRHQATRLGYYSPPDHRMNVLYLHTSVFRI
jgi:hypothetical protein